MSDPKECSRFCEYFQNAHHPALKSHNQTFRDKWATSPTEAIFGEMLVHLQGYHKEALRGLYEAYMRGLYPTLTTVNEKRFYKVLTYEEWEQRLMKNCRRLLNE